MHMVFYASMDGLHKMLQFVRSESQAAGFEGSLEAQIEVALEEAIVNIIEHGYIGQVGDIQITCTKIPKGITIILADRGVPYNPLSKLEYPDLDSFLSSEHRNLGGFGVHLILSIMDHVEYDRQGEFNVLTLTKYYDTED